MTNQQANNYDAVSKYYDRLGALVFAGALMRSQAHFLPYVPEGSRVLIVGGGTGKILDRLAQVHPQGLQIHYVELSAKMLEAARGRNLGKLSVRFVHSAVEDFECGAVFDAVVTPFLFDNFLPEKARSVHQKIDTMLAPGAYWLYTDFVNHPTGWRKWLLQGMYAFFRKTAYVEARQLPDMTPMFAENYQTVQAKRFFAGMMEALVYRKSRQVGYSPNAFMI